MGRSSSRFGAAAFVLALVLPACAPVAAPTTPIGASATPAGGTAALPAPDELLPRDVAAATPWQTMASLPSDFDAAATHASPNELADAFGAAVHADWAGSPDRPDLALEVVEESADAALLIVSETGVGDDAVAGTQYALFVRRGSDGWVLDELRTRALCRRGASGDLCV